MPRAYGRYRTRVATPRRGQLVIPLFMVAMFGCLVLVLFLALLWH